MGGLRQGYAPFEDQPVLVHGKVAAFRQDGHLGGRPSPVDLAQVEPLRSPRHAPLNLLDDAQKEQGAGAEAFQALRHFSERLLGWRLRSVKGEDKQGCPMGARLDRRGSVRADIVFDVEVFVARVNLGQRRVRIDGLEADAELPDFSQVLGLGAFANPAHPAHVFLVEQSPIVSGLQPVGIEHELDGCRARILRVLEQLVDKVGTIGIEAAQKG